MPLSRYLTPMDKDTQCLTNTHILKTILTPFDQYALFLDIDGTLLDIAAHPEQIIVPSSLPLLLQDLSHKLKGALAFITGRPIPEVDKFLPLSLPIAGLHGTQIRTEKEIFSRLPQKQTGKQAQNFQHAKAFLFSQAQKWPNFFIEDKGALLALHFRNVPNLEAHAQALMEQACAFCEEDYCLQTGKMVIELKPRSIHKGHALAYFMTLPAFKNRIPIAIGDDVSDEAMFEMAKKMGGKAIRVGEETEKSQAQLRIVSPTALRSWLSEQSKKAEAEIAKKISAAQNKPSKAQSPICKTQMSKIHE